MPRGLKHREFSFCVTFALPSPLKMLELPNEGTVVRNLNNRDLSFKFQEEDDFEDEIFK